MSRWVLSAKSFHISGNVSENQFTVSLTLIFVSKGAVEWLIWNDIIWLWHNQGSFSLFSWISGIGYSIYKWIRQTFSAPKWRKKNVGHIKSLLFLRKLLRNDFLSTPFKGASVAGWNRSHDVTDILTGAFTMHLACRLVSKT